METTLIVPTITRREWRNVFIAAILIMAMTVLPYLSAASAQHEGYQFGWFLIGIEDGNSYLGKMRQGAVDGWLFHIMYTSEPHDGAFLFTPYLAAGKVARLFASPDSPALVNWMLILFHAARLLFGLLLIVVTFRFVAIFVARPPLRLLATILITVGGGLGWLLILIGQGNLLGSSPVDFISPEAYTFHFLYGLPHLSLARACLLGGLMLIFRALSMKTFRGWLPYSLLAGLCWLIMGLCVPFFIGVLFAVLGVWGIAAWIGSARPAEPGVGTARNLLRRFPLDLLWRSAVGALIPAPLLLYSVVVLARNPIMQAWQAQNTLPSPHPLHYVLGYGIYIVLALIAIRPFWRASYGSVPHQLIPAWVVAGPVLAYFPIAVQRRLLEGFFVPLCILAVCGMELLRTQIIARRAPRLARTLWRELVVIVLVLTLPTSAVLMATGWLVTRSPTPDVRLYHTTAEIRTLDWLNVNMPAGAVVLADFEIGNYLPARTSLVAFVGHGPETIHLDIKGPLADRFLKGQMSLAEQRALLDSYSIQIVIFSPQDWQPAGSDAARLMPELRQIYDQDGFKIYRYSKS